MRRLFLAAALAVLPLAASADNGVPDARVAAIPPSVASGPGSIGKNSPVSRSSALSCLRVTPA